MSSEPGVGRITYDQVNLSFFEKFHTADRGAVCDFDPDIRISLVKFTEIFDQEITADRITGSDVKLSSAYADIEKLAFPTLDQADRRFDMAQKNLSFGSKTYFLGASDE